MVKYDHPNENNPLAEFPLLASLRISADDLRELPRQGFVCEEKRGNRKYFKLRFRSGGRQVVRYLGNAKRAAAVERELFKLQNETRVMRGLKTKVKIANKMLREAKISIKPVLEANGLVFHGWPLGNRVRGAMTFLFPLTKPERSGRTTL